MHYSTPSRWWFINWDRTWDNNRTYAENAQIGIPKDE